MLVTEVKNMPTYFFICFLIIFSVMLFKFVPTMLERADKDVKLRKFIDHKYKVKYFSETIGESDIYSKVSVKFIKYSDNY